METILVFDRPFTSRFNAQYRPLYGGQFDVKIISDFKYRDDVGLIVKQYKHLASPDIAERDLGLDYAVVARRCRYLRALSQTMQRRLINSAWLAIRDVFEAHDVRAFIGLPMDNYYLDLIDQYCTRNGIFTMFPVQSFLPNRTRMTRRGEHIPVREVGDDEVAEYRDILMKRTFRPTWLMPIRSQAKLFRMFLREVGKNIFFDMARAAKRDPYSFHYLGARASGPSINIRSGEVLKIRSLFMKDTEAMARKAKEYKRAVFLPLQFSPESSLDYNIADSRFSWYDQLLDTVVKTLPADTLLIVKEHPDMFGYRRYSFFERFLGRENVLLVDVAITVQQIFDVAEFILVSGGASTGGEAAVKGKTVISLGGAFYGGQGAIHEILNFDDVPRWSDWLRPIHNDASTRDGIVRQILTNTLPGAYDFVRISRDKIPAARENVRTVMEYVLAETAPLSSFRSA